MDHCCLAMCPDVEEVGVAPRTATQPSKSRMQEALGSWRPSVALGQDAQGACYLSRERVSQHLSGAAAG